GIRDLIVTGVQTCALPILEKKYPEFRATLRQGLSYLIFVNLLASVLLLILAEPIVRLLFERGAFNAESTVQVSRTVACLAPGLRSEERRVGKEGRCGWGWE